MECIFALSGYLTIKRYLFDCNNIYVIYGKHISLKRIPNNTSKYLFHCNNIHVIYGKHICLKWLLDNTSKDPSFVIIFM